MAIQEKMRLNEQKRIREQERAVNFRMNKKFIRDTLKNLANTLKNKRLTCFKYLKEPFWNRDRKVKAASYMLNCFLDKIYKNKLQSLGKLAPFSESLRNKRANLIAYRDWETRPYII